MFAIECPVHGHQVLVPPTRIRGLSNTAHGILVTVECWCGAQVAVRTGRRQHSGGFRYGQDARGDSGAPTVPGTRWITPDLEAGRYDTLPDGTAWLVR